MGCQLSEGEGSLLYLFQSNCLKIQLATLLAQCAGGVDRRGASLSIYLSAVTQYLTTPSSLLTRHSYQSPAAGDTLILQIV